MFTTPRPSSATRAQSQQPERRHRQLFTPISATYLSPPYTNHRATSVPGPCWNVSTGDLSVAQSKYPQLQVLSPQTTPSSIRLCAGYGVDKTHSPPSKVFSRPPPIFALDDQSPYGTHNELTSNFWSQDDSDGCERVPAQPQQTQHLTPLQEQRYYISRLSETQDPFLDENTDMGNLMMEHHQAGYPMAPDSASPRSETALETNVAATHTPEFVCLDSVEHSPPLLSRLKLEPTTPPIQTQQLSDPIRYPSTDDVKEGYKATRRQRTDPSETDIICKLCIPHRGFVRQYNLSQHMKIHSEDRPRAYECDEARCGLRFRRPHDLQRHVDAVHHKSKLFKCRTCHKGFPRKDSLQRHSRSNCIRKLLASNTLPKRGTVKNEYHGPADRLSRRRRAAMIPHGDRRQSCSSDFSISGRNDSVPIPEGFAVPEVSSIPGAGVMYYASDPMGIDWNSLFYMPS